MKQMSIEQIAVLAITATLMAGLVFFPPYRNDAIIQKRSMLSAAVHRQTSFLLMPPSRNSRDGYELAEPWTVNWGRLFLEVMLAAGVGAVIFFIVTAKRQPSPVGASASPPPQKG